MQGRKCSCDAWYYWKLSKTGYNDVYLWLCGIHTNYWRRRGWKFEKRI